MIQQEGPGWRVIKDLTRGKYSVLIGSDTWAVELKEKEWIELASLVLTLQKQHHELINQLMKEETIEIELDRGEWWGCLWGDSSEWSLSLVLSSQDERDLEVSWPAPAASAVVDAMRTILDNNH
tara:strand:+ start:41 stop:412 length:372 start_codon:yes stop_codon:yes gene_type:complete